MSFRLGKNVPRAIHQFLQNILSGTIAESMQGTDYISYIFVAMPQSICIFVNSPSPAKYLWQQKLRHTWLFLLSKIFCDLVLETICRNPYVRILAYFQLRSSQVLDIMRSCGWNHLILPLSILLLGINSFLSHYLTSSGISLNHFLPFNFAGGTGKCIQCKTPTIQEFSELVKYMHVSVLRRSVPPPRVFQLGHGPRATWIRIVSLALPVCCMPGRLSLGLSDSREN